MKKKLTGPPAGESWVWQTLTLKTSAAWLHRSHRAMLFTEFLEVENMRHSGFENGNLLAPYNQLMHWGLRRETIIDAIQENIERKLVVRTGGGGVDLRTGQRLPYTYRLTYLPTVGEAAGNEWRRYKGVAPEKVAERVEKAKRAIAARWERKKQNPGTESGTRAVPKPVLGENENSPISAKNPVPKTVPGRGTETGTTFYISGVSTPGEGGELPTAWTACPVTMAEYAGVCIGAEGLPVVRTTWEATFSDYTDPECSAEIRRRFDAAFGSRRAAA